MEVSLYSAAAAMNATERWQDLVADNLSSASIPGARQQEISFSAVSAGYSPSAPGTAGSTYEMPFAGATTNFSQGELKATGGNLDIALEGKGFFGVEMPDGSTSYTRDGEFQMNAQGQLTTKQGYPVDGLNGPVMLNPRSTATVHISVDGQVTQGVDIKGKLAVTEFGNMKAVTMGNGGFFVADPAKSLPKPNAATAVRQGFVEASNTSPMLAMAGLITSMRMFESNQKVMEMQGDRMSKTITDLSGTSGS